MRTRSEGQMPAEGDANPRRLYLKEPGWRVAQKTDSEKAYLLHDGPRPGLLPPAPGRRNLLLPRHREALRRVRGSPGLLSHAAKPLREPLETIDLDAAERASEFDLYSPDDGGRSS